MAMNINAPEINSETNENENFTLFITVTICGFLSAFIPLIVKIFLHILNGDTQLESSLRRQFCDLKAEIGTVNMINEFAKYTKIERKLNKVIDELKNQTNRQSVFRIKLRIVSYAVLYTLLGIVMLYLVWNYRYTVLIHVPHNLFYPFGFILSFPTGINDALTITPWTALTTFVGRRIVNCISF